MTSGRLGSLIFLFLVLNVTTCIGRCRAEDHVLMGMFGFNKCVRDEKGVRDLKELGADFVSGVSADDRETLDLLHKQGLRAIVTCLPRWWGGDTKLAGKMAEMRPLEQFRNAALKFRPHPAILSVAIGDEPSKLDFDHYGKVMQLVRKLMPTANPSVVIFPDYGSLISNGEAETRQQLGTDSYEDYVRSFCERVPSTDLLSIDDYPYSAPEARRAEYFLRRFAVMTVGGNAARDYGREYELFVQANSLFPELVIDLPRLRYQAYTDLAFGARRLNFACYSPLWWTNNIITAKGEKTQRYHDVQKLISEIRNFDREFMRFRNVGTRLCGFSREELARIGNGASCGQRQFAIRDVMSVDDDDKLVIGEMVARDGSAESAVFIAGADDPEGRRVRMRRVRFRAVGDVRAWNREGPIIPIREKSGMLVLDIPSDGMLFIVADGIPIPSDGTRISSAEEWLSKGRPAVLDFFDKEIYGLIPPRPAKLSFDLFEQGESFGGRAERRQYRIVSEDKGGRHSFDVLLYLPKGVKTQVPCFEYPNFSGNHSLVADGNIALYDGYLYNGKNWGRGGRSDRVPVEQLIGRGFAFATWCYCAVYPDYISRDGAADSIYVLFPERTGSRPAHPAWCWGTMRVRDLLATLPEIDQSRVGIVGQSRMAKNAILAGAHDERFAFTGANCGGVKSLRHLPNLKYPYWFAEGLKRYVENAETGLPSSELQMRTTEKPMPPFEQSALLGCIAPRALYVEVASEDRWSQPEASKECVDESRPVFALFGEAPAFKCRNGVHSLTHEDWSNYMDYVTHTLRWR